MILPIQLIISLLRILQRRKLIIILRPILIRRRSLFDLLRLLYGLRLHSPEQLSLPLLLLLLRGILLLLILPLQQLYLLPIICRHSSMVLLNLLNAVRCELLLVLRVLQLERFGEEVGVVQAAYVQAFGEWQLGLVGEDGDHVGCRVGRVYY